MNAANAKLNGEYAKHVRKKWKRTTAHIRRAADKKAVNEKEIVDPVNDCKAETGGFL